MFTALLLVFSVNEALYLRVRRSLSPLHFHETQLKDLGSIVDDETHNLLSWKPTDKSLEAQVLAANTDDAVGALSYAPVGVALSSTTTTSNFWRTLYDSLSLRSIYH
jgi:hypothetical protein